MYSSVLFYNISVTDSSTVMSFAASTVPGSKQQFVSTRRYAGQRKIIAPKNQQLHSADNADQIEKKNATKGTKNQASKNQQISRTSKTDEKKTTRKRQVSPEKEGSTVSTLSRPGSKTVESELDTIAGNDIWITSKSKYDEMVYLKQRHELRIQSLEADLKEVLEFYEMLYKENEVLKEKLNLDEQLIAEPYKTVYNDRGVLRSAEFMYKKRIAQLQKQVKDMEKENSEHNEEIKRLKAKLPKIDDAKEKEKEAKYNKMFWENRNLKTENHSLIRKLEMLSEDLRFYKNQQSSGWDSAFMNARDVLFNKSEPVYGNENQEFAIFEHEAKRVVAELEEKIEKLTAMNGHLKKQNQNIKKEYEIAMKKQDELNVEKNELGRQMKLLHYRLGDTKSSKTSDKSVSNYDHAKLLFRFQQQST